MDNKIENIQWQNNDFSHSYVKALHLALIYKGADLSIAQVAGRTGMAFRTMVHKELCPSAMSVSDWKLMAEGASNCGYNVNSILRLWNEEHVEEERRLLAIEQIIDSIDKGVPAVVWDVAIPEWEVISGYDLSEKMFDGLSVDGNHVQLPFGKLGRREIPLLFVLVIGDKKESDDIGNIKTTLKWAIDAISGNEYTDRPAYESGYKAYRLWSEAMTSVKKDDWESRYYLQTYETMKGYGAKYLKELATRFPELSKLAKLYDEVHLELSSALVSRNNKAFPTPEAIEGIQDHLLKAEGFEQKAKNEIHDLVNEHFK